MGKKFFYFLVSILLFSLASCVPHKDIIYLQGNPVNKTEIHQINNKPYKLQVDDIIDIDIKAVNDSLVSMFRKTENKKAVGTTREGGSYYSGYTVDNHGNIRLPYLNEINVLGYTTVEVREKIEEELGKLFKMKDEIFITVKLAGIKYTVFGEVESPGPKVIYQNRVSIIDALSNSGDITLVGNKKQVEVIRNSISGTKKYIIDLTSMNAFNSEVFYIKPNDYIHVPPLKQKALGTGTTGAQTLTTIISIFSLVTSTILLVRNL